MPLFIFVVDSGILPSEYERGCIEIELSRNSKTKKLCKYFYDLMKI